MADVRATIERLFATGRYADIQVDAEPYQDGVDRPLPHQEQLVHRQRVGRGQHVQSANPGQLENAARLDLGQPYTEAKLQEAVAGQQRLLESNGLYRERHPPGIRLRPRLPAGESSASKSTAGRVRVSPHRC